MEDVRLVEQYTQHSISKSGKDELEEFVVLQHADCRVALAYVRDYFGGRMTYLYSDFQNNHTFVREVI
jgi:hypothetical protein